jgi:hypothetical protein
MDEGKNNGYVVEIEVEQILHQVVRGELQWCWLILWKPVPYLLASKGKGEQW